MIEEIEEPKPRTGQLLIGVEATDLNFADILQCQGRYQVKLTPPFSPGMNAAGTILAVGDNVEQKWVSVWLDRPWVDMVAMLPNLYC